MSPCQKYFFFLYLSSIGGISTGLSDAIFGRNTLSLRNVQPHFLFRTQI